VLTLQDCFQLGELTEGEISAIAEHERIPAVAAAGLGHYLLGCPDGTRRLMTMIEIGFIAAKVKRDSAGIMRWQRILSEFREKHPLALNARDLEWQNYGLGAGECSELNILASRSGDLTRPLHPSLSSSES
jgi:hypothetical protein